MVGKLLEYEARILLETFSDDVLFIFARGLGMERLLLHHLKLYCDPKVLVLVINTLPHDEAFIIEQLKADHVPCLPKIITSDILANDRKGVYSQGGVQFVTSRILIVDLLTDKVPMQLLAGVVVLRAHQLIDSFQETFILRLFREKKQQVMGEKDGGGFVKAFTDTAACNLETSALGQLQRLTSRLYVRRVELVPRFQNEVKNCFANAQPELIEIEATLTRSMRAMQSALLDLLRSCTKELKQCSPQKDYLLRVSIQESDLERRVRTEVVASNFWQQQDKSLVTVEDDKSARLLAELQLLRGFLRMLEQLDPVTLYLEYEKLWVDQQTVSANSGWMFTKSATTIRRHSRKLIGCPISDDEEQVPPMSTTDVGVINQPPKWAALKSVLDEIKDCYKQLVTEQLSDETDVTGNVLVLCASEAVCRQVRDLIEEGADHLCRRLNRLLPENIRGATADADDEQVTWKPWWPPSQMIPCDSYNGSTNKMSAADILEQAKKEQKVEMRKLKRVKRRPIKTNTDSRKKKKGNDPVAEKATQPRLTQFLKRPQFDEDLPLLVIRPLGERYRLLRTIDTIKPTFIILYQMDLAVIRQLELYKASNPRQLVRIYLLMYRQSSEEERYLYSLRREQQSFEQFIREKGTLLVPRTYDVARDVCVVATPAPSTRKAGGRIKEQQQASVDEASVLPRIVVDAREFNSELPLTIYRRGIDVVPLTLEVGDYVLTPTMCVERKSPDDLAQSLVSGRLFTQAEQMLRHYSQSVLLIEGNPKAPLGVRGGRLGGGGSGAAFQGRMGKRPLAVRALLTQLCRRHPTLKLVWSLDPDATVQLFEHLKFNQPQPNPDAALALKSDELTIDETDNGTNTTSNKRVKLNPTCQKILMKLPGGFNDVDRLALRDCGAATLAQAVSEQYLDTWNAAAASSIRTLLEKDFRVVQNVKVS